MVWKIVIILYKYCANIVKMNIMQILYEIQVDAWEMLNPVESVSFYNGLWLADILCSV